MLNISMLNVRDFGAVGDGKALDTTAVQRALDAAFETGKTLYLPEGTYRCGALFLHSNTDWVLSPNAVLMASADPADYPPPAPDERMKGFLNLENVQNVHICGGRLCSDDAAFWEFPHPLSETFEPCITAEAWFYTKAKPWRFHMLNAIDSRHITLSDMTCTDYPCYAYNFTRCSDLAISNLLIRGKTYGINTDGIHLSSCRNVTVHACNIRCGDDCIAVDSDFGINGNNITVSDCVLETSVHAFRFYVGLDSSPEHPTELSNITVSNCTVVDAAGIFNINARRGHIDNIAVSNITATQTRPGTAFVISSVEGGKVDTVRLSGLTVNGNGCGLISADQPGEIENIRLSDAFFRVKPCPKHYFPDRLINEGYGFPNHCHFKPVNFYLYQARNVFFSQVTVLWEKGEFTDSWSPERRKALRERIAPVTLDQMEPHQFDAVDCHDTTAFFDSCHLPAYDDRQFSPGDASNT